MYVPWHQEISIDRLHDARLRPPCSGKHHPISRSISQLIAGHLMEQIRRNLLRMSGGRISSYY